MNLTTAVHTSLSFLQTTTATFFRNVSTNVHTVSRALFSQEVQAIALPLIVSIGLAYMNSAVAT